MLKRLLNVLFVSLSYSKLICWTSSRFSDKYDTNVLGEETDFSVELVLNYVKLVDLGF